MDNSPLPIPPVKETQLDILAMIGEILALCILFIGALFVLNYFRIVKLEQSFPVLTFLPHQQTINIGQQITAHINPPQIHYNSSITNATATSFLKDILQQQYLPTTLNLQQTKISSNAAITTTFFDSWQQRNYTFGVQVQYGTNTTSIEGLHVSATFPQTALQNMQQLTPANTHEMLKTIFIQIPDVSSITCSQKQSPGGNKQNFTLCESFQTLPTEKIGSGALFTATSPPFLQTFTCKILKSDPYFNSANSCFGF